MILELARVEKPSLLFLITLPSNAPNPSLNEVYLLVIQNIIMHAQKKRGKETQVM